MLVRWTMKNTIKAKKNSIKSKILQMGFFNCSSFLLCCPPTTFTFTDRFRFHQRCALFERCQHAICVSNANPYLLYLDRFRLLRTNAPNYMRTRAIRMDDPAGEKRKPKEKPHKINTFLHMKCGLWFATRCARGNKKKNHTQLLIYLPNPGRRREWKR